MSIWKYDAENSDLTRELFQESQCIFCRSPLRRLETETWNMGPQGDVDEGISHASCTTCGWWTVFKSKVFLKRGQPFESWYGYSAALKQFDLYDISIPIGELKNYLIANYGARLSVHPQRFEEVVASVFSNIGYSARVTGCSGDGGIDVILDGPDGSVIGVQVKRSKNTIEVEQIRSLAGALIIKGITRGIFVTTSSFRAGAPRTARLCSLAGIPIELIDAQRFYEALKLSQSKIDEEPEQTWPPEKLPQLQFINSYRMNSL